MPIFDLRQIECEFDFHRAEYSLRQIDVNKEIPDIDLFSKQDRYNMLCERWAIIANDAALERYKTELNMLLMSFRIFTQTAPFIKYRLCLEQPSLCRILRDTVSVTYPEKTVKQISKSKLILVDSGFKNLLEMQKTSNRTVNALYFLHRAFHLNIWIDAFLFYINALESLFSKNRYGGATKTICSRVTSFLADESICKYEDLEKLYNLRSAMVHDRMEVRPDPEENLNFLALLETVVTNVFRKFLTERIYQNYPDENSKEAYWESYLSTSQSGSNSTST